MTQITTETILEEYKNLTSYEKADFNDGNFSDDKTTQFRLGQIGTIIGDRIFKTGKDIQNLSMQPINIKLGQPFTLFMSFTSALFSLCGDLNLALMAAELLARNVSHQIGISRDQLNSEFKKTRFTLRQKFNPLQEKTAIMAQNLSGHWTDPKTLDPLERQREYVFYDAFAIMRGPGIAGKDSVQIIEFGTDIMSAQTNLTTETNPGTFQIVLANPCEQYVDDYGYYSFKVGNMIQIWATDRFQGKGTDAANGAPYRHIFWGILEKVQDSYSDGGSRMTLSGQDVTAWFAYTTTLPAPTLANLIQQGNITPNAQGHKYAGMSIFDIITDVIFNDFGNFNQIKGYSSSDKVFTSKENAKEAQTDKSDDKAIIEYWNELFLNQLQVKIFPFNKLVQKGQKLQNVINDNAPTTPATVEQTSVDNSGVGPELVGSVTSDPNQIIEVLAKYVPIMAFGDPSVVDTFQIEDVPKIEIIRRVLEGTQFEFFMDTDGSLVFKPPFYNEYPANNNTAKYTDVLKGSAENQTNIQAADSNSSAEFSKAYEYIIEAFDVISFDITEDSSALVTRQGATGEYQSFHGTGMNIGYAQNNDLVKRFGLRAGSTKKLRMITQPSDLIVASKAIMDAQNLKYYTGTITIIGRPEIHLGRTIFFVPRNVIFYVTGISHNFTAGGTFTTTLTVTAGRRMFVAADGKSVRKNVMDGTQFGAAVTNGGKNAASAGQTQQSQTGDTGGVVPRRLSDSFGRRLFGMLGYGLATTMPAQGANSSPSSTGQPASGTPTTGPVGGPSPGPPSSTQFQANLPTSNSNVNAFNKTTTPDGPDTSTPQDQYANQKSSGGQTMTSSPKRILETTKNCANSGNNKSFDPSSIVRKKIVNGTNL